MCLFDFCCNDPPDDHTSHLDDITKQLDLIRQETDKKLKDLHKTDLHKTKNKHLNAMRHKKNRDYINW